MLAGPVLARRPHLLFNRRHATHRPAPRTLRVIQSPRTLRIVAETVVCKLLTRKVPNCLFVGLLPLLDFAGAQISLSNPLTIPVSFRVGTNGPFAINPTPSKKRLHNGKRAAQKCFGGGGGGVGTDSGTEIPGGNPVNHHRGGGVVGAGRSPKRRRAAGGHTTGVSDAMGTAAAAAPTPVSPRPTKTQRHEGREVVLLLPGQNLQLELVFMPSRSPEMSESLASSFSPGTEVPHV